jgi:hypothetical protein
VCPPTTILLHSSCVCPSFCALFCVSSITCSHQLVLGLHTVHLFDDFKTNNVFYIMQV